LKNPNGDDQLESWDLTENGGKQWKVEDMPGDCGHDFCKNEVTKYFATSSELCLKKQVIDLLKEGYNPDQLDAQPPVKVEDWFCGRTDCGCTYQMTLCLLDKDKKVLLECKHGPETLDPELGSSWRQVTHTFSKYGPGMRFISFEHGGHDTSFWEGWFGVRVTGSSVTLDV
ncbi:F-box only protein 6-like, partial [Anableps anableps]